MAKLLTCFALLLLIFNFTQSASIPDNLVISLPNGQLQGASYSTSNGKVYYGFRGIPFAEPPVGELRYESPKPAKSWTGILNATADRASCLNLPMSGAPTNATNEQSEDCLYINVYVPNVETRESLPVMLWIYGGGFNSGGSTKDMYSPDFLIEKDVIFVSFNYRLGPFGFISTQDSAIPGNLGMKDQVLALKWTRDNIQYFGGDPKKVTLFGQSAGGISTAVHLISPASAGLFSGAIIESGSAVHIDVVYQKARELAFALGDAIGGGNYGNDSRALKAFLKSVTADDILRGGDVVQTGQVFVPTIEPENEDAFLTESPYGLLERGDFMKIPFIIGMCAEEGLAAFMANDSVTTTSKTYDEDPTKVIPTDLYPNSTVQDKAIKAILGTYLEDGANFQSNLSAIIKYYTDNMFGRPVLKHADLASRYTTVYLYQFAYSGRASKAAPVDGVEQAAHGAEIPFLFPEDEDTVQSNLLVQNRMVEMWTNFAKYLNPTPEKSELLQNVIWPKFTVENGDYHYLNINASLSVGTNVRGKAYASWNNIYESYGRKPFITF